MQSGRKKRTVASESLTKKRTAELLGVSRSSLYYIPKQPTKDEQFRDEILQVLNNHKDCGTRRIAWELGINRKHAQRVMRMLSLIQPRKRKRKFKNQHTEPTFLVENHLVRICPRFPGVVWQTDFTYLIYKGRTLYFATVVDRVSREVLGEHLANLLSRVNTRWISWFLTHFWCVAYAAVRENGCLDFAGIVKMADPTSWPTAVSKCERPETVYLRHSCREAFLSPGYSRRRLKPWLFGEGRRWRTGWVITHINPPPPSCVTSPHLGQENFRRGVCSRG